MVVALSLLVLILGAAMVFRPRQATSIFLGGARRRVSDRLLGSYVTSVRLVGLGWFLFGVILLVLTVRDALRG